MCDLRKFNFNLLGFAGLIIILTNQLSLLGQELTGGSTATYAKNVSLNIGATGLNAPTGLQTAALDPSGSSKPSLKSMAGEVTTLAGSEATPSTTLATDATKTAKPSTIGPTLTQKALIATDPAAVANSLCTIPFLGLCAAGPTAPDATPIAKAPVAATVPPAAKAPAKLPL